MVSLYRSPILPGVYIGVIRACDFWKLPGRSSGFTWKLSVEEAPCDWIQVIANVPESTALSE